MRKNLYFTFVLLYALLHAQQRPKIGLVLSGGGAKGYAHVGVLEVLEKEQIPIDYIGGTSMGAIVGGLYASGYSAKDLNKILHQIDFNKIIYEEKSREKSPLFQKLYEEKYLISLEFDHFKLNLPKSVSKGQGTTNTLTKYLQHTHDIKDFSKLTIPFLCIATDLETGKQKVFKEGYLPQVIMASGAYPTLFASVKIDSAYYIDGGIKNNFPVQEVKDMGADIIIGVDLGEGLLKEKEIKNAASLLGQIISYGIENKTTEQRKKVDILIKPNIKGFSITSFQEKDTLISLGRQAAQRKIKSLDSLTLRVGKHKRKSSISLLENIYLLKDIEIEGLKNYSKNYVLGKMGFKLPQAINYDMVIEGIESLYSTGNFDRISNRLEKNKEGSYTLFLKLEENQNNLYVKAGLHYDELFKSSLLLNFTAKNIISINSTLSLDVIFGDNPRYYFNYFVDNGIVPSFGVNSNFMQFAYEDRFNETGLSINYDVKNIKNQAYIQSTLYDKYAIGLGLEHQYINVSTKNLPLKDERRVLQKSHFYIPYTYLRIDNRDNRYFPTKGININTALQYILHSSASKDIQPIYLLKSHAETNIPLAKFLTLQMGGFFNTGFNNDIPKGLDFYVGGLQRQEILNTTPFHGIKFASLSAGNLLQLNASLQFRVFKKQYLKVDADFMSLADRFSDLNFLNFSYQGYGLSYGYDSPFGPIIGTLSYSPFQKSIIPYISLGYSF